MSKVTRINLWSGPRNISTALMYSFAQRSDTEVVDEPLYAHYLRITEAHEYHPGAEQILASQEQDGEKVIHSLMTRTGKEVYFFKHMTHHFKQLDGSFMKDCENIILTRDPREMIPSFDKVIPNPTMADIGYADHLKLIEYFNAEHINYHVLDSKSVLLQPENTLKQLCARLDIPFDISMLQWEEGPRDEDGVWAKYWYHNVHHSTGFAPYTAKNDPFPEHLNELLAQCIPIFNALKKKEIQTL